AGCGPSRPLSILSTSLHIPAMAKSSSPKKAAGFAERPQQPLSGTPLSGSISDWAEEIAREADAQPVPGPAEVKAKAAKGSAKPAKKIPERSTAPGRSGRGTSMGGAASVRERAAVGLNPIPGL